jgi:hypothetical protein
MFFIRCSLSFVNDQPRRRAARWARSVGRKVRSCARSRSTAAHRDVGSSDRRTIEQRGSLTRQALEVFGSAERDRRRGLCDGRRIGRDRRNAQHRAARPRRGIAVVLMPGVPGHDMVGIGVMLVRGLMFRLRAVMNMRGGCRPELVHEARRGFAERQRGAGCQHAKQIEQGSKPPRFDAHRPRQANEHGGRLMPAAVSAKMERSVGLSLSVIPGRAKHEPGISRFRVRAGASPRNDGRVEARHPPPQLHA